MPTANLIDTSDDELLGLRHLNALTPILSHSVSLLKFSKKYSNNSKMFCTYHMTEINGSSLGALGVNPVKTNVSN